MTDYTSFSSNELEEIINLITITRKCYNFKSNKNFRKVIFLDKVTGQKISAFELEVRLESFKSTDIDPKRLIGFFWMLENEGVILNCSDYKKAESDGAIYYILTLLEENFINKSEEFKSKITALLPKKDTNSVTSNEKSLKSIHLVSQSVVANDTIFLVLDEQWQIPIRFQAKNSKGEETSIKKLHNIAYFVDAPGKKVEYNKNLTNDINNGIFRKSLIANYMRTNKLNKPTIVNKTKDGILVLRNEISIKTLLVRNIPTQYQSLYVDKTR